MAPGEAPRRRRARLAPVAGALLLALAARGVVAEPYAVESGAMAPTLLGGDVVLVSKLAYALRLPLGGPTLASLGAPRRGDVVVFRDPTEPSRTLVKRVVGLPGETVELVEQLLLVDGVPQGRVERGEYAYEEPAGPEGPAREDTCHRFTELLDRGPAAPHPPGADPAAVGAERLAAGQATRHDLLQCRRQRAGRREGPFGPVRPGHLFVLGDNRDRSADGRAGWEVPISQVVGRATLVAWSWGPRGSFGRGGRGLRLDRLFKPVE